MYARAERMAGGIKGARDGDGDGPGGLLLPFVVRVFDSTSSFQGHPHPSAPQMRDRTPPSLVFVAVYAGTPAWTWSWYACEGTYYVMS